VHQTLSATRENQPDVIPDRQWIAAYLGHAIAEFQSDARTPRLLQRLAREYPDLFFTAAVKHLESDAESPGHRFVAGLLLRQDLLLERLVNPARCSCESAVLLFRRLLAIDPALDFRLARMLPGRNDSISGKVLTGGHAARAMDILDQTSQGQRLISAVGHLPNSADRRIAAKAALFVGRRVNNPTWTAKQLNREDQRLRANAIEASWGAKSEAAIRLLKECTADTSNRVVGNALMGLHMAGCPDVAERALAVSRSDQPGLRATAAWAMGKIGNPAFIDRLTALLRDENREVRSIAVRSLVEIRRAESARRAGLIADVQQTESEPPVQEAGGDQAQPETQDIPVEVILDGSSRAIRR
jgi:HEAT repeats